MREIRLSGSEGGGPKPIASPYPYQNERLESRLRAKRDSLPPYILSAAPARFLTGRFARTKSVIGATCYTSCPAASMNGCRASLPKR